MSYTNLWQLHSFHTKAGPVQDWTSITPIGPWTTSGPLWRGCSQHDSHCQSFLVILVTWPHHRSWDLWIRKSGLTFKVLRIALLPTLSRSVTPWSLRKNPIFAACTLDSSLPVIKQDSWAQVKIGAKIDWLTALRWLNVPVLWPWNDQAHLILCLLYQSVYQCRWMPSWDTWTSRPLAVY